jgi:hypothetical protein
MGIQITISAVVPNRLTKKSLKKLKRRPYWAYFLQTAQLELLKWRNPVGFGGKLGTVTQRAERHGAADG